jgi:hypothetical protein
LQAKRAQEAKVVAEELLNTSNSANSAALQEAVNRARSRSHSDSRDTSGLTGLDATPQHHRASWVDVPTPLPGADTISPVQPTAMNTVFTPESHQNVDHSLDSTLLTPGSPLSNTNELRGLTDRESRQFLIKLEQELIASGTDYSPPKLRSTDPAHQRLQEGEEERGGLDASDSAEMMRFLNMSESNAGGTAGTRLAHLVCCGGRVFSVAPSHRVTRLHARNLNSHILSFAMFVSSQCVTSVCCTGATDAEGNKAYSKEAYETHVRRLMFILEQEKLARLRLEDKLDETRVRVGPRVCIVKRCSSRVLCLLFGTGLFVFWPLTSTLCWWF